jgi:hypothetical protein
VRRRRQAQVRKWRNRRVSASTAFRPIPPVHMTDLEAALRVELISSLNRPDMTAICANLTNRLIRRRDAGDVQRLTNLEQKANIGYDRGRLALYPFVVVRIACRVCSRSGSYRLARLAAKYGPEITLRDLTERFSYDCLWRAEARSKKGKSACGVYLPDLEHKRPPDLPPGMVKLRLVKGLR